MITRKAKGRIGYPEYKRRIFNEAVLYGLCQLNRQVLGIPLAEDVEAPKTLRDIARGNDPKYQVLNGDTGSDLDPASIVSKADAMAKAFYGDELKLDKSTVSATKKKLSEACHFLSEMGDVAEEIADRKAADAKEDGVEIMDDQKPELSPEDKAVLNQVFVNGNPTDQVSEIRDATVKALVAEEEKAKEIRDAIEISKSRSAAGDNPQAFEETVRRIEAIGPTSVMNAIMNHVSTVAIRDITEAGRGVDIPQAMKENSELIKDLSSMMYVLYESAHILGIHRYTPAEAAKLAQKIYYQK